MATPYDMIHPNASEEMANYQVATPADWQQGEDVIVTPAVSNDLLEAEYPKGITFVKPYLRTTPQPDK